jgi:hypothetical protein
MLELASEDRANLFPLGRVGDHLPLGRNGKPISPVTAWRWASQGLRGVRLETIKIGSCRFTSMAALTRFFERVDGNNIAATNDHPTSRTPGQRRRASEEADRELVARGR